MLKGTVDIITNTSPYKELRYPSNIYLSNIDIVIFLSNIVLNSVNFTFYLCCKKNRNSQTIEFRQGAVVSRVYPSFLKCHLKLPFGIKCIQKLHYTVYTLKE